MSTLVDGDPNAPILVVGMAPGREELEANAPFVGPSGRLLWGAATRAGFTRANCYILNTIGEIQAKEGPSPEQFEKYWDAFSAALEASQAKVALLLGGDALWRVTGLKGIQGWRGYLVKPSENLPVTRKVKEVVPYKTSGKGHKKGDPRTTFRNVVHTEPLPPSLVWMVPSLHPSAVMRTGYKSYPMFAYDVARVGRAHRGELHLDPPLPANGTLAFDIETANSLAGDAAIVQIGLADHTDVVSLPWDLSAREITRKALSTTSRRKIAHNIGFDLPRLEDAGVEIPDPIFCTMFACQMLQPDCAKGLNTVASMYLDTPRWKHKKNAEYNWLDVRRTRQLADVVRPALAESGQLDYFEGTVMPAVRTYVKLTRRGLHVDVNQQNILRRELGGQIQAAREAWWGFCPGVNPNSHQQLKELFYETFGWPVQRDHYGKVSVDKSCLGRLVRHADRPEIVRTLLALRKLEDQSEFLEVPLDGRNCVHPSYVPASKDDKFEDSNSETKRGIAGTGRPQAHDPNIMQVPKAIRTMYISHHPGWSLVEFDFDAAELRVAAAVSGDTELLRDLGRPDPHTTNAIKWGCSRSEAKTVAYGTLYGMGARKLHGLFPARSTADCQRLLDAFFTSYPGLLAQRNRVAEQIKKNRYLVNAFSRRRYFWDPEKDFPAALDFIPQSTVADIVWSSVNGLYTLARNFDGYLLTTVHDSFLFEFPPDRVAGACQEIEHYLTRPFENVAPGFHLPVSYSIGPNWGALDEVADVNSETYLDVV